MTLISGVSMADIHTLQMVGKITSGDGQTPSVGIQVQMGVGVDLQPLTRGNFTERPYYLDYYSPVSDNITESPYGLPAPPPTVAPSGSTSGTVILGGDSSGLSSTSTNFYPPATPSGPFPPSLPIDDTGPGIPTGLIPPPVVPPPVVPPPASPILSFTQSPIAGICSGDGNPSVWRRTTTKGDGTFVLHMPSPSVAAYSAGARTTADVDPTQGGRYTVIYYFLLPGGKLGVIDLSSGQATTAGMAPGVAQLDVTNLLAAMPF